MNNALIEKLQKLLTHEQSARAIGSLAEAEAFATKIQQLLSTYNLSMSDIEIAAEPPELIERQEFTLDPDAKRASKWQWGLANALCYTNNCKLFVRHNSNLLIIIGKSTNRLIVTQLFTYFVDLAEQTANTHLCSVRDSLREAFEQTARDFGFGSIVTKGGFRGHMRSYKNAYLVGFSDAVGSRLRRAYDDLMNQAKTTDGGSHALLRLNTEKQELANWLHFHVKGRASAAPAHIGNRGGYAAGQQAGSNASLSRSAQLANGGRLLGGS